MRDHRKSTTTSMPIGEEQRNGEGKRTTLKESLVDMGIKPSNREGECAAPPSTTMNATEGGENRGDSAQNLYSNECLQSLTRSGIKVGADFTTRMCKRNIEAPLPTAFRSLTVLTKKDNRRCLEGNYANFFYKILHEHNPYGCWSFKYNRVRGKNFRGNVPYFKSKAICTITGCKSAVYITVRDSDSSTVHLQFSGEVHHPSGVIASRRITCDERKRLQTFFVENRSIPPSNKYREELANIEEGAYAAGNHSGAGKSKTAMEKLAYRAREEASSCENLREKVIDLQRRFESIDEEEAVNAGHVFRHEFGYIHKASFTPDSISIILIDEPMARLYHEHVQNDILYIDATGSVAEKIKGYKRLLYYVAAIRHPFGKSPPMPIAEFITTAHDRFSIQTFLMAIHEKEYRGNKGKITNPRIIITDFSWAIILACMKEFCNNDLREYLDRTFRIVMGKGTENDIGRTIIHICLAHVMNMNRKEALKLFKHDTDCTAKVHFIMRFIACIVNAAHIGEVVELMENGFIVMTSKVGRAHTRASLHNIELKINNLNIGLTDDVPSLDSNIILESNIDKPADKVDALVAHDDEKEVQNSSKSLMHGFWAEKFDLFHKKVEQLERKRHPHPRISDGVDEAFQLNRYYMPKYLEWLKKKLPFITLWSNLCLGDLNRYNANYNYSLPVALGKSIADCNKTNATVEHFFTLKKSDRLKMNQNLPDFIEKCWQDNRGLRRQFVDGLQQGLRESRESSTVTKEACRRLTKLVGHIGRTSDIDNEMQSDHEEICTVEETWNKSVRTPTKRKDRSVGYYQKDPANPITFAMTKGEKEAKRRKRDDAERNAGEEHTLSTQKTDSYSTGIGYSAYKREVYRKLQRCSTGMDELRSKLKRGWDSLTTEDKNSYRRKVESDESVCFECKSQSTTSKKRNIDWVLCDTCTRWYHIDCIAIDKHYANASMTYICPLCVKGTLSGILNFSFHFARGASPSLPVNCNCLLETWKKLPKKMKDVVENFSYSLKASPSLSAVSVGDSLSSRGIMNSYNNCWANSVLQALCGSPVSHYLPSMLECPTPVCNYLRNIKSNLLSNAQESMHRTEGSLSVLPDVRNLISRVYNRDQTIHSVQDDAADFLQMILKSLSDHCEPAAFHFKSKTMHISGCRKCYKTMYSVSEDFYLHLAITLQISNNVSVQSLLWEWCINSSVQNTVNCDCMDEACIWHRSFILNVPQVLILLTDRLCEDNEKNEAILSIDKTLQLRHLLAGKLANNSLRYNLAAIVCHYGSPSNGHYDACLFNDKGQACKYNDTEVSNRPSDCFLKKERVRKSTRILFYVREGREIAFPNGYLHVEHDITEETMYRIERVWFGLQAFESNGLDERDLRRLAGKEKLNGEVILSFMHGITLSEIGKGRNTKVLSNYLLSDIQEGKRNSFFLNNVVRNSVPLLDSELILLPYHQKTRDHWSVVALYPKKRLIVHCDSMPHISAERALIHSLSILISKLLNSKGEQCQEWYFLPMQKLGRFPVQADSYTCGMYACIFSYALLASRDIAICEEFYPLFRYWIAWNAMVGARCAGEAVKVGGKVYGSLWSDTHCQAASISYLSRLKPEEEGAFEVLAKFIESIQSGTLGSFAEALSDGEESDSCDLVTHPDHEMQREFKQFCERESPALCDLVNRPGVISSSDMYNQTSSERLTAVAALPFSTFRLLQRDEEFPQIRNNLQNQMYSLLRIVHKIFCKTKPNDNDSVFAAKNISKFPISKTRGMSRSQFVERVVFPELLTYFFMEKYGESYEQATGRLYGKSCPTHTVYWQHILRVVKLRETSNA